MFFGIVEVESETGDWLLMTDYWFEGEFRGPEAALRPAGGGVV
jgi:hypothetical protein